MDFIYLKTKPIIKTATGFEQTYRRYQAKKAA